MSFGLNMCIIENDFGFIDFICVVDCGVLQNASGPGFSGGCRE
tara:strand:+ start:756 stop:884 length:129 start_codon:yes stop_codon:yes gene_type:complete